MASATTAASVDTLIIGCGMAGLAAGIRLAMFGQNVLILEKHNAPGGLNSFYFKDARKFDVGLHAVTNYVPAGTKGTPLVKLLRQLRIGRDELQLAPQLGSRIAFPGVDLPFNNQFAELAEAVARLFPDQIDGFNRLRQHVLSFDAFDLERPSLSARAVVETFISDPLLADMLFCPLMYYGSAREHDMDYDQFVTLWKALFEEGFGRPLEGVRVIIRALLARYRAVGGKRRMQAAVKRILLEGNRAAGVELEGGDVVMARRIISTAGWPETRILCEPQADRDAILKEAGRLSFCETINVLNVPPARLGLSETIVFFNDSERFHYAAAETPVDLRSGVLCCPNNYAYAEGGQLEDGFIRVTAIACPHTWRGWDAERYAAEKAAWSERILASALRFAPGVDPQAVQGHTICHDMFTPRTIERYTSHLNGAVYGAPVKLRNGRTPFENLYVAGTDQGFLGIIGAMLSGISMANQYGLGDE